MSKLRDRMQKTAFEYNEEEGYNDLAVEYDEISTSLNKIVEVSYRLSKASSQAKEYLKNKNTDINDDLQKSIDLLDNVATKIKTALSQSNI